MFSKLFFLIAYTISFLITVDAKTSEGFSTKIVRKLQPPTINDVATQTWSENQQYLIEYYIGNPPVRTYGVIDTGGGLVLLECSACAECPLFNPLRSKTYLPLACEDPSCRKVSTHYCKSDQCQYEIIDGDDTYTVQKLASETLYFSDDEVNGGNHSFESITIGCKDNNDSTGITEKSGLIGLNRSPTSFIQQFIINRRFLYCFGDWDSVYVSGYIKFGIVDSLQGDETPILSVADEENMHYHVNLEDISVDGDPIGIAEDTFTLKLGDSSGGFIIDTATTYTRINITAFKLLSEALDSTFIMDHFSFHTFEVCYEGEAYLFAEGPKITFHFSGADLLLATWNTWVSPGTDIYCLAMHPTMEKSILGNFQQQNVEFGYDLEKNVIHIDTMTSCGDRGL